MGAREEIRNLHASAHLPLVWREIASRGTCVSTAQLMQVDAIATVTSGRVYVLLGLLQRIVYRGWLETDNGSPVQRWWYGPRCIRPKGEDNYTRVIVGLPTVATARDTDLQDWAPERERKGRAGSTDFMQYPSRRGDRLYYRDGRITDLDGNPVLPLEPSK